MNKQFQMTTISGWTLLAAGLAAILLPEKAAEVLVYALSIFFLLTGITKVWVLIKRPNLMSLLESLAALGLGLLLIFHTRLDEHMVQWVSAGYLWILAFFLLVQCVLDFQEKAWKSLCVDMALFLVYLIPGLLIIRFASEDLSLIMRFFGLYLMLMGAQMLMEIDLYTGGHRVLPFVLQDWISLPVGFVSFLPGLADTILRKGPWKKDPEELDQYNPDKKDKPVNFSIYIHAGLSKEALIGHMTMSYQNIMYSYGDYDRYAEKWFHTMGPGVLFLVNPEIYCNNTCVYEKTDIYEFGLHLDPLQQKKLESVLEKRLEKTYPWQCPLQMQPDPKKVFPKYENVYCNRLWYRTGCGFHKFLDSPWTWYFIVGMNCSLYADTILAQIGCHIPHKRGVVSPGEYLDYFETAYADPDSPVVYRSWHSAAYPDTLFDAPD